MHKTRISCYYSISYFACFADFSLILGIIFRTMRWVLYGTPYFSRMTSSRHCKMHIGWKAKYNLNLFCIRERWREKQTGGPASQSSRPPVCFSRQRLLACLPYLHVFQSPLFLNFKEDIVIIQLVDSSHIFFSFGMCGIILLLKKVLFSHAGRTEAAEMRRSILYSVDTSTETLMCMVSYCLCSIFLYSSCLLKYRKQFFD